MRHTIPIILITTLIFTLFSTASQGIANDSKKKASLTDIIVTTSEKELIVFSVLNDSFNDEMIQGLHSGIPVHFSFFVELILEKPNWFDKELVSMEFKHILEYDTLKEIYRVKLEEMSKKDSTFKSIAKAQKAINEINNLKIIKLAQLQPDQSYTLRIKAELFKKTLPMKLHYLIPFISLWDIETNWHAIDFKY